MKIDAPAPTEGALGRAAAERLAAQWPNVSWVPIAPSAQWAEAAIQRFAEMIREQPSIFRASQRGAGRGARSLSPRPFQGLMETLQNANDLAATEIRLACETARQAASADRSQQRCSGRQCGLRFDKEAKHWPGYSADRQ